MIKNKKKIVFAGMVLAAGIVLPTLKADPIGTITLYQAAYNFSDAGEFTAVTSPNLSGSYVPGLTSDLGGYANSFQTFCVQATTDFAPGVQYNYSMSFTSLGGIGYPGGNVSVGTANSYDLSAGTAWLYSQFATGALANYFNGYYGSRAIDAGYLQATIWLLQGGQVDASFPIADNIYYTEALAHFGGDVSSLTAPVTSLADSYGVEILNLTDNAGGNYQNQLVYVPDGGTTVVLLGLSLGGLGLFTRKLRAARRPR